MYTSLIPSNRLFSTHTHAQDALERLVDIKTIEDAMGNAKVI